MKSSITFLTVVILCILSGAEVDLFVPSFPELQKIFNLNPFMVELTLSANFIAYCISCLAVGALGDRYGRKPIIILGLLIFILGSVLCVFADCFSVLIMGRFLQGIGVAGPAVLSYVIIADQYKLEEQQRLMGVLNGMVAFAMAFAPVIGSYVNLYFGWRGNFVILLALGIICFIMVGLFIENKRDQKITKAKVELIASYLPVLCSRKVVYYTIFVCFLVIPYWVFIGISPILYMEDFQVPLKEFGYYQGALAITFSVISITSTYILKAVNTRVLLYSGLFLCALSAVLILILGVNEVSNPLLITSTLIILSVGVVIPANIIYPAALEAMKDAKGKIAAMILSARLAFTALGLEIAGYFHQGTFKSAAYIMFVSLVIALYAVHILIKRGWFHFDKAS